MKTIAIIPARGGSKRLPNKNRLLLGDYPLLVHSILYAQANSDIIDAVYVSTDDPTIKAIALTYGAQVIDRPASISDDFEPTLTSLQHVLQSIDQDVDNVVVLQPTNPLRPPNLLKKCFEKFQNGKVDSLFTVTQTHQKLGKIANDKFVPYNYEIGQRSQDLKPLYFENGLLYITKVKFIFENKIITENAFPYLVSHIFANVDIDTKEDMEYAAYLYQKNTNPNS
ncbi:cytidylyltransferase domain-containing protein [Flavobacterium sp.]|uniref:acylneuraminate cytidylyltransferase family protein n=1 Tax=Flavobacterium sp. TaxID=239 RepID=UPI00375190F1